MTVVEFLLGGMTYINLIVILSRTAVWPGETIFSAKSITLASIVFIIGALFVGLGTVKYPDFDPISVVLVCFFASFIGVVIDFWPRY